MRLPTVTDRGVALCREAGLARAVRVAGHFGELMQGRIGPDVALITLPCPVLTVTAAGLPGGGLRIHGAGQRLLSPERARAVLDHLGISLQGRVILRATMPAGGGAGASTAALVALARLAGWRGEALALARACVAVEGASDPLMFPMAERLLWASRRGKVLAHLPALPRFEVVGGFFGAVQRTDAADTAFPEIADLVGPWDSAARAGDLHRIAALASHSARRSLALRGQGGDPTEALAQSLGALGFVIAHTGAARGLIFAPGTVPLGAVAALRAAGFRQVIRFFAGG